MSNWFHHDPATGRNGPLSTDGLLERYRRRLVQADTLVWREGLPEWQTLERAMADLGTVLGPQDASVPPPLPAFTPAPAYAPAMGAPAAQRPYPGMHAQAPQKKGMSGCLIALIVVAVLAVPMIAILAAIALPAYRDYTVKAKVAQAIGGSLPLQEAIIAHVGRNGACPSEGDTGFEDLSSFARPPVEAIELGVRADGACQFGMTLPQAGGGSTPGVAVMSLGVTHDAYAFEFDCEASTLAPLYLPATCRNIAEDSQ
jgi:type IV pilus assembly protein PilA